ncbi:hypothetical protein [Streptomyces sp. TBY4]|uniref:hypothetical protein n=1 Tax=Streptomyces sp. TBY4 TaxID=2962030 RepID=UPI0020B6C7EA|nr:hypothetical protein [Streptomyces sp. TBY4]MCP3758178.1 hypothetical protein [Streptomyces sp. TBY4]
MNTKSISGAAKVICARMGRPNAVGATIAVALDAGGWLNTEDAAVELVRLRSDHVEDHAQFEEYRDLVAKLRARVAELEAAQAAFLHPWIERLDAKSLDNFLIDLTRAADYEPMSGAAAEIEETVRHWCELVAEKAAEEPYAQCPTCHMHTNVGDHSHTAPDENAAATRSVDAQLPLVAALLADRRQAAARGGTP